MKNIFGISILTIISIVFVDCSSSSRYSGDERDSRFMNISDRDEIVIGLASYYAHKYHGRQTANGEKYDMYGLTAAHNYYPFDTIIEVTNLKNDKKVKIRINDRMPKHPTRIIDLSYGTALELDMIQDGVVKVRLEIIKWGDR